VPFKAFLALSPEILQLVMKNSNPDKFPRIRCLGVSFINSIF